MAKLTFHGGIHPYDGKDLSKDKPMKVIEPPKGEMVYPLSQHIGAMAVPVVAKGDRVLTGQKIAEAGGLCIGTDLFVCIRNGKDNRTKTSCYR